MAVPAVSGTYKGIRFRSLLELSFMKHLERQGIDVKGVEYETLSVPYEGGNYAPDFYVPAKKTVYEVKHSSALRDEKNLQKFAAATAYFAERGMQYSVVTEKHFTRYTVRRAKKDPHVVLNETSLKHFRKVKRSGDKGKRKKRAMFVPKKREA